MTHIIQNFSLDKILNLYESQLGIRFSPQIRARYSRVPTTTLLECGECGLQFFSPAEAGGADFYDEVSRSSSYYLPVRWEFAVVQQYLLPSFSILEAGCGVGAFLKMARPLVERAVGLELDTSAAERAGADGLDVRVADLQSFSSQHIEGFDVVCAFHLLEHLPNPYESFRALVKCLKSKGSLFVSVPNRNRLIRAAEEPGDCPPHHLSRWAPEQLISMGHRLELDLIGIAFEPPDVSQVRAHVKTVVRVSLRRTLGLGGTLTERWVGGVMARVFCAEFLHRLFSRRGWFQKLGWFGHSMLAHYRKV